LKELKFLRRIQTQMKNFWKNWQSWKPDFWQYIEL
jgi:hypothetical protein